MKALKEKVKARLTVTYFLKEDKQTLDKPIRAAVEKLKGKWIECTKDRKEPDSPRGHLFEFESFTDAMEAEEVLSKLFADRIKTTVEPTPTALAAPRDGRIILTASARTSRGTIRGWEVTAALYIEDNRVGDAADALELGAERLGGSRSDIREVSQTKDSLSARAELRRVT